MISGTPQSAQSHQYAPQTLVIGPDLRIVAASAGWQKLGLADSARIVGERIRNIFPGTQFHAAVLDVLASGQPVIGEIVQLASGDYLCVSLQPLPPNTRKPKKVLVSAEPWDGQLCVDEESGEIIQANEAAAAVFGMPVEYLIGQCIWSLPPFATPGTKGSTLEALDRKKPVYLGTFKQPSGDGEVELEAALVVVDE
jgi:hypothetical protein